MANLVIYHFKGTSSDLAVSLTSALNSHLSEYFTTMGCSTESLDIPQATYSPQRMQYLADPFLDMVESSCRDEGVGFGLVDLDLYVPSLNFIFGLAAKWRAAIVALPRLRQRFYGQRDDDRLFHDRLVKESIHELGHVLGLGHCRGRCVMRFSNSLDETDAKSDKFCAVCHTTLKQLKRA